MTADFTTTPDFHSSVDITATFVAGLESAIAASGLPFKAQYSPDEFRALCTAISEEQTVDASLYGPNTKRAHNLAAYAPGEGHHCYLCGVNVQFNLTAPRYMWPELQRYHFMDIVSSTSTMHKLIPILQDIRNGGDYKQLVSGFEREVPLKLIDCFYECACEILDGVYLNCDKKRLIKQMLPEGWKQTARITTNYRQLKTIYMQRHDHDLVEWREFCEWVKTLPMAELITNGSKA